MNLYSIIVAGGSGSRMQSEVPKQFIKIGNKPVLMHTIQAFYTFSSDLHIILVLPEREQIAWKNLCEEYHFTIPHQIVSGGKSRFESVKNGLSAIQEADGLVAVHDGVRPFVPISVIEESFKVAKERGNAVASVASKDSLRQVADSGENKNIDRSTIRLIQTPQTFTVNSIKKAFKSASSENFTDDASVAEAAGEKIHLIEGSYRNIKITTPEDLLLAESFLLTV